MVGLGSQMGLRLVVHYNGRGTLGGFELRLATILFLFQRALSCCNVYTRVCVLVYVMGARI